MRGLIPYIFILVVFSNCSIESKTRINIISSLETKIDSLNEGNPKEGEAFVDSLLQLEPKNYLALKTKGLIYFNDQNTRDALEYLQQAFELEKDDPFLNMSIGWCHERQTSIDSALYYYRLALENIKQGHMRFWKPQMTTIVEGPNEGLKVVNDMKDEIGNLFYYWLLNDIPNYEGTGMSEFFPPFFDYDSVYESDFYVQIPDELFNSGQINSMQKVQVFFAKLGINVFIRSTDSANHGYTITTTERYLDQLSTIDTLEIKKL